MKELFLMKITFIGAGSTVFARNVIGDCILTPELGAFDVCLFDIDPVRLEESYQILSNMNATANGKATITRTLDRTEAFTGADFVVNAIQVGGYDLAQSPTLKCRKNTVCARRLPTRWASAAFSARCAPFL